MYRWPYHRPPSGSYFQRGTPAKLFFSTTDKRPHVILACTECKRRNYITTKNRQKQQGRMELKKYCRWCRCHRVHRETR